MPNPVSYGRTMALLFRDQSFGPFCTFRHSKLNENWASVRRRMGAGGKKVELFRFSFVPTMNNNVSISACGGRKDGFGSDAFWSNQVHNRSKMPILDLFSLLDTPRYAS